MAPESFKNPEEHPIRSVWDQNPSLASTTHVPSMPLKLEVTSYQLVLDDSPPWKVHGATLRHVGGHAFAKFKPYDPALVALVCHGLLETPKHERCSLAATQGYRSLLRLRSAAVAELDMPDAQDDDDDAAERLFGGHQAQNKKGRYKRRMSMTQLQDLRRNPEIMEFSVPGGDRPDMMIAVARPGHPCEDLCVKLEPAMIEHVVRFIRLWILVSRTAPTHITTAERGPLPGIKRFVVVEPTLHRGTGRATCSRLFRTLQNPVPQDPRYANGRCFSNLPLLYGVIGIRATRWQGLDFDVLCVRRPYKTQAPGFWRMGSAGVVRRLADDSDNESRVEAGGEKKPKFRVVRNHLQDRGGFCGAVAGSLPLDAASDATGAESDNACEQPDRALPLAGSSESLL